MKLFTIFRKTLLEQSRDRLALGLSLLFAPFFVLLYYLFFPSGSTNFTILVINQDIPVQQASGVDLSAGDEAVQAIGKVSYPNGNPLLVAKVIDDPKEAETRLRDRSALVLITIPQDFSKTIQELRSGNRSNGVSIHFGGDLTNPYYPLAAILATNALNQYIYKTTGLSSPVDFFEEPLGGSGARSEFETYIPGLLIFAVIMLVYLAAMVVAREVEAGTLRRLQLTRMSEWDFMGGISAGLILIGIAQVLVTFLTAWLLGFRSQGPLWVAILVGVICSFGIIGSGLLVACFTKTVTQAYLAGSFPMAIFMFFSGAIYPMPKIPLFTIAGRVIGAYDILPPTHAVVALNKVLNLGAGLADIQYELVALILLSIVYFVAGVWIFKKTHLRRG